MVLFPEFKILEIGSKTLQSMRDINLESIEAVLKMGNDHPQFPKETPNDKEGRECKKMIANPVW